MEIDWGELMDRRVKRRTTPKLKVRLKNLDETLIPDGIDHIEFIFKQYRSEDSRCLVSKTYPGDVVYENGCFLIPFTEDDTCKFAQDRTFFMDTRPVLATGDIPRTPIVSLMMDATLFGEDDTV